jgi:hypothetical protein
VSTGSEAGSGGAIGVVYLARCAEGAAAFRRFADSYRRQPAGRDHQLIVIYKGFAQRRDLLEARAVFDDLPHLGIELDDSGFDIGAYLEASRRVTHDYLCFLNTYSELAASGWLAKLADHGLREGVGIAGAMGSYESLFDSIMLMRHARWARDYSLGAADRERTAFYYGVLLDRESGAGSSNAAPAPRLSPAAGRILRYPWYRWKALARLWPGAQTIDIRQFPSFPNPHLRSNGFIIGRERLRRFDRIRIGSKSDANRFESGRHGLTAALRRQGLAAIVVGRDGSGYDVPDWPSSRTFRLGEQENLLLTDNQSRNFASLPAGTRATYRRMSWGDYLGAAPHDFPDLGFAFGAKRRLGRGSAPGTSAAVEPDGSSPAMKGG